MTNNDDLTAACRRASSALTVAAHFAEIVDDIRSTKPAGYGSPRSYDGTPRPVEDVVIALDDRGVSDLTIAARRDLQRAAELIARAANHLDGAVTAWEGAA